MSEVARYDVTGSNRDQLHSECERIGRSYFGNVDQLQVGLADVRPLATHFNGTVLVWQAEGRATTGIPLMQGNWWV